VENRRHLVDERTRLVNQQHSTLKTYFPLALDLLEDQMNTLLAAELLLRWPSLAALQKETPKALRAFFYKHNSRNAKRIEQRIQAVPTAKTADHRRRDHRAGLRPGQRPGRHAPAAAQSHPTPG